MLKTAIVPLAAAASFLGACSGPNYNAEALRIASAAPPPADLRSIEVRRFDGASDAKLFAAITATMQDLGFTVTEASSDAGVVTAAKTRSAVEAGQVAAAVGITIVNALFHLSNDYNTFEKSQEIHVTVVSSPAGYAAHDVRVSFDRVLTNNKDQVDRTETIVDPKIYADYFTRLQTALR